MGHLQERGELQELSIRGIFEPGLNGDAVVDLNGECRTTGSPHKHSVPVVPVISVQAWDIRE